MARNRAWRRYKNYTKAKRKRKIDEEVLDCAYADAAGIHHWYWYNNLHQYSKGKIHCSCALCSAKTNNKHRKRRAWAKNYSPSRKDRRKDDRMNYDYLIF